MDNNLENKPEPIETDEDILVHEKSGKEYVLLLQRFGEESVLPDKNDGYLFMTFAATDPHWLMEPYFEDNSFVIPKEHFFFPMLEKLFQRIEKVDDPRDKTLVDNCFTWYSEAHGGREESNILTIKKLNDSFEMSFFNNPKNPYYYPRVCSIRFSLSGSRNERVAGLFSQMLNEFNGSVYDED